jgi:hypothetical protein
MVFITFKRFTGLYFWSIWAATVWVVFYTIAVVLYNLLLGHRQLWLTSVLLTIGYLAFVPSRWEPQLCYKNPLTFLSRLQILQPGPKMTYFVQALLISEYLLMEIPVATITLVLVHNPTMVRLFAAAEIYLNVAVVLLAVVFMIMPGLYLYLAWSEYTWTA